MRAALQKPNVWAPGPLSYGTQVPNALLVALLGLVYAPKRVCARVYACVRPFCCPSAFAALFFVIGAAVWRYQVLFVYTRAYESNGAWWPHMAMRILSSLALGALGHATLAGVLALKLSGAVPHGAERWSITVLAGPALLPLPISVAVFARHYRRRFGVFRAWV